MTSRNFDRKPDGGAALIIVLACLIFVSVLTVAFLMSMRSKLTLSKSGSDTDKVQALADTCVNIAISQVHDATVSAGQNHWAWASQPGMIRLYNDSGAASGYHKLYSWDNMVGSGAFAPSSVTEQVPDTWAGDPALFADLNAPENHVFPILDYGKARTLGVEGLSLGTVPGSSSSNPAPMPVKWLYVLADGAVYTAGAGSSGSRAVIPAASKDNPIVGRIAFWADDETCKVNINTASIGLNSTNVSTSAPFAATDYNTFWDTPRFSSPTELNLANYQPAQGEYQRYPGHPATAALNAVFPAATAQQIFEWAPRYAYDGSKGGTVKYDLAVWIDSTQLLDRLYPSPDEMIFGIPGAASIARSTQTGIDQNGLSANETLEGAKFFLTATSRAPELNLFGEPRVSIWPIDSDSLTNAVSPRVSTPDRLLAFCSSVGGQPFYFTRHNRNSSSSDISQTRNLKLLEYLDALSGQNIPGFGGNFRGKYAAKGTRQVMTEIYDYVRTTNLQDSLLPGYVEGSSYGGNNPNWFAPKLVNGYGLGSAQVVPSIHPQWNTQGFGRIIRPVEISIQFIGLGDGKLVTGANAIPIPQKQIQSANIAHESSITLEPVDPLDTTKGKQGIPPDQERAIQAVLLINMLSVSNAVLQNSYYQWIEITGLDTWTINGKNLGLPADGIFLFGANPQWMGPDAGGSYQAFLMAFTADTLRWLSKATDNAKSNYPFYGKIITVPASDPNPTMSFSGGPITVKLYDTSHSPNLSVERPPTADLAKNKLIQTYSVSFPSASSLPVPDLTLYPIIGSRAPTIYTGNNKEAILRDSSQRIINWDRFRLPLNSSDLPGFNGSQGKSLIDIAGISGTGGDVVQSMVLDPAWSDARLLALSTVPVSAFAPHPNYGTTRLAHNIFYGNGQPLSGNSGVFGSLVQNADYGSDGATYDPVSNIVSPPGHPLVPPTLNAAPLDWDNGVGSAPDGPWINAPDGGNMRPVGQKNNANFIPYFTAGSGTSIAGSAFFSPNRQICSPGMFGSLSTGVDALNPTAWRTLLFRPLQDSNHLGHASPRDSLLMDLFWMPCAEPYAISEPMATAGKINLNQQLVPFTYINRTTALRAAMSGEKVAIMAKSNAATYKREWNGFGQQGKPGVSSSSRLPIDLDETMKQVAAKFSTDEIFRSPTEICDLYFVPQGYKWPAFKNQWYGDDFALVGDNVRERPYATIYGKITTKSNTYTVHYRAQALQQTVANLALDPTVFDPSRLDRIVAEQRGAVCFERYLDPSDPRFTSGPAYSFLTSPASDTSFTLESLYRTRILSSNIFRP